MYVLSYQTRNQASHFYCAGLDHRRIFIFTTYSLIIFHFILLTTYLFAPLRVFVLGSRLLPRERQCITLGMTVCVPRTTSSTLIRVRFSKSETIKLVLKVFGDLDINKRLNALLILMSLVDRLPIRVYDY